MIYRYAPLVLVTVLVAARSSAEWIPDVREIPDFGVDQRSLADGKRRPRVHDKRSDEERGGPPPHLHPEFLASWMRKGESSADPLAPTLGSSIPSLMKGKSALHVFSNVPNKDVSHLKSNIAFTQRMEELDINIDDIAAAVKTLRTIQRLPDYNDCSLTLMAIGNEYFKKVESLGVKLKAIHPHTLETVMSEYLNSGEFKRWMGGRMGFHVSFQKVYGKMRWLEEMGDFKMIDKDDLADMAFGSEFFKINKLELALPSPVQGGDKIETLDQLKHQIEQLAKQHDVDPKVIDKLGALAKDPGSIGKTEKEILREAKDAVLDDELVRLKTNKAFTQRMEELEINIDGDVKAAVQSLRKLPGLLRYDDYSLYLMALGRKYFEEVERYSGKTKRLHKFPFDRDMEKYADSDRFKRWADEHKHYLAKKIIPTHFYGKMRRLMHDEQLSVLTGDDLANMAFGSEFFSAYNMRHTSILHSPAQGGDKIETLDQLKHQIEQLAKQHDDDPKVLDKLRVLAEDPGSIGKTKREILRRAKDAVLDDEVDSLKSNKAFIQRMEKLEINIDAVKVAVQRLRKQPGLLKFDDYSLYWMALGSVYFKEVERHVGNIESISKHQLEGDLSSYVFHDEFKRWTDERKQSLFGISEKSYGKMRWLKRQEHLKLKDEELWNMAFGSEFFKISEIELPSPLPIQDGDKIETLDQPNRLVNQLPKEGNGDPNNRQKLKNFLEEDPKKLTGLTAEQLKRKALHAALGDALDDETTNKKSKNT